jgi:hypothetical protein
MRTSPAYAKAAELLIGTSQLLGQLDQLARGHEWIFENDQFAADRLFNAPRTAF